MATTCVINIQTTVENQADVDALLANLNVPSGAEVAVVVTSDYLAVVPDEGGSPETPPGAAVL